MKWPPDRWRIVGGRVVFAISALLVWDSPAFRAYRACRWIREIDRVEVYRLQGTNSQLTEDTFPILPESRQAATFGKIDLTGRDMIEVIGWWHTLPVDQSRGGLCHFPVYGLSFMRGDRVRFQTSLCWQCENFYVDSLVFGPTWCGFQADAETSVKLLAKLDAALPHDRNFIEREAKEADSIKKNKAARK